VRREHLQAVPARAYLIAVVELRQAGVSSRKMCVDAEALCHLYKKLHQRRKKGIKAIHYFSTKASSTFSHLFSYEENYIPSTNTQRTFLFMRRLVLANSLSASRSIRAARMALAQNQDITVGKRITCLQLILADNSQDHDALRLLRQLSEIMRTRGPDYLLRESSSQQ
jgi:hypothetical protein